MCSSPAIPPPRSSGAERAARAPAPHPAQLARNRFRGSRRAASPRRGLAAATMQRQQQRRRHRQRRPLLPPAIVLCLVAAAAAAALPLAAAGGSTAEQDLYEYVVVFKRGFDAGRIRALCADRATAAGRLAGLCRRRFSAVLNGFAGAGKGGLLWLVACCAVF